MCFEKAYERKLVCGLNACHLWATTQLPGLQTAQWGTAELLKGWHTPDYTRPDPRLAEAGGRSPSRPCWGCSPSLSPRLYRTNSCISITLSCDLLCYWPQVYHCQLYLVPITSLPLVVRHELWCELCICTIWLPKFLDQAAPNYWTRTRNIDVWQQVDHCRTVTWYPISYLLEKIIPGIFPS